MPFVKTWIYAHDLLVLRLCHLMHAQKKWPRDPDLMLTLIVLPEVPQT